MPYNRKYIGARYVPKFAKPIAWDITKSYEPLTIVMYNGDTYTSAQYVPSNIPITNDTYWVKTADFNAQVAQLAEDLNTLDGTVDSIDDDVTALESRFPVSVADGGTGVTSFVANKILKSNAAGNGIAFADSADIAQYIGNNPVARAVADEDGNDIADTYAKKTDVNGIQIFTNYSEIFNETSFNSCNVDDIAQFKLIKYGKICYLAARFSLKNKPTNHTLQRFGFFNLDVISPVAPLDNISGIQYQHISHIDTYDGIITAGIIDNVPLIGDRTTALGFVCNNYDTETLPDAGQYINIETMFLCE